MVRQLSLSGRAVLPAAQPGNVWTGLGLHPHQARLVQTPDLHTERARALEEILEVIAPVRCVLTPPVAHRPWRLAVRAEDVQTVLDSLRRLPVHWDVAERRDSQQITVCQHLAIAGRPFGPVPDLEVTFDVLRREGDAYVGGSPGALGHIDAAQWDALAEESLAPERRRPSAPEPAMPIDVVYTWVDGADMRWRERRDAALRMQAEEPAVPTPSHASAVDASRFLNSDELRYSLRSVHRYANWVRRIHIVTDGQVPSWLRGDDPRIQIVDHQDLLGGSRFNSHAIESALHRIHDLAEHYLYLNDDVFFGRIAYPGDFYAAEGVSKFFPSDLPIDPGPAAADDLPIMAAAKNGRDLIAARFGIQVRTKIRHTVHAQLRSVAEQIEAENPEAVAATRASPFRSPTDLSIPASLHHWYAYALGRAVPTQPNYLYLDLADRDVGKSLDALESLRRYDTFCLNQEEGPAAVDVRRELSVFLDRYLPTPAPWEKSA